MTIRIGFFTVAIACGLWIGFWSALLIGSRAATAGAGGVAFALGGVTVAIAGIWGLVRASLNRLDPLTAWMVLPACFFATASTFLVTGDSNFVSVTTLLVSVGPVVIAVLAGAVVIGSVWHPVIGIAVTLPLIFAAATSWDRGASIEVGCLVQPVRWQIDASRNDFNGQPAIFVDIEGAGESLIYPQWQDRVWLMLEPEVLDGQPLILPEVTSAEFRIRRQLSSKRASNFHLTTVRLGPYPVTLSAEIGGGMPHGTPHAATMLQQPLVECSETASEAWRRRSRRSG